MRISDSAIRRPVATAMVALGLIIFGIIGVSRMKIDLLPNVTLPQIIVVTLYPGAGPEEVESEITNPIEERLGTISNLRTIKSRSQEGISVITLDFEWGTNLDAASSDVRGLLDMVQPTLPSDASKPYILKLSTSLMPVASLYLSGEIPESQLREIAEDCSRALQRVPGVAMVSVAGGAKRQVQIDVDLRALAQTGITTDQFILALKSQNLNFPVGTISTESQRFVLRLIGQYEDLSAISNTPIGSKGGVPVFVRDVAKVLWAQEEKESEVRINQKSGLFLTIQRRSDANTVSVANAVREEIKRIQETLPPGVELGIFWDTSDSIKRSVNNVVQNLLLGGILVIIVLFLFLGRFRPTLFVAFAIPISIFFALFLMSAFGFTINILSMAGLAIAVGMVVDCGIVVFEAIFRHREWGETPTAAASIGTQEVSLAITASTLTTIAVFFPLLLLRGMMQVFFKELSWAIILSLLASLGVALTLIPMLTSRFLKVEEKKRLDLSQRIASFYRKVLDWAINHRVLVISLILILFIISLSLIPFIGTEFIPEQRMRYTELIAEMPVGSSLSLTNQAISELERYIIERWGKEIEKVSVQAGGAVNIYSAVFGGSGPNSGEIDLVLKKNSRRNLKEIEEDLRRKAREIPGLVLYSGEAMGRRTFLGGAPIQIEITGEDLKTADSLTQLIIQTIETIPGVTEIRSSREKGSLEVQLIVDRQKAMLYGLTPYQIGSALRTQIAGQAVSKYRLMGKEYDIFLRLTKEQRDYLSEVLGITVTSPLGPIPLRNLVQVVTGTGPLTIEHKNTERIVTITANVVGQSAGRLAERVKKRIAPIIPPPGFSIKLSGSYEEMMKSFRDIFFAVMIAVILVFMIMAGQFESFRDPFVILFTIPLAAIGVLWILFLTGTTLSLISGIGMLVLVGVVVNNGIVYVDYVNQLRRNRGMPLAEAVRYGGEIRLRPILMTALTTIFGLLPLALKIGEGAELWSPLGRSVIGGMVFSTFLTLIFIPVLYFTFERRREKV
uniref:Efflux RND transporter permease subunit n=1 Tax=candidate division WOR-3 bacterium TaxID=2052148 RepID=A0A7C3UX38_UNCW3